MLTSNRLDCSLASIRRLVGIDILHCLPSFLSKQRFSSVRTRYDQNPSHLKPPPEPLLARAVADLAGSPVALARSAKSQANTAVGCSLVEFAWLARDSCNDEDRREINLVRADLFARRAKETTSLMAQSILMKTSDTSRKMAEEEGKGGRRL